MSLEHCIDKVTEIIARGRDDRRSLFQLGYNLGRLSELTGQGARRSGISGRNRWNAGIGTPDGAGTRLADIAGQSDLNPTVSAHSRDRLVSPGWNKANLKGYTLPFLASS